MADCNAAPGDKEIKGTVFNDVNANGIDDGESGIAGIDIEIYRDNDQSGTYSSGDVAIAIVTTNGSGEYEYITTSATDIDFVMRVSLLSLQENYELSTDNVESANIHKFLRAIYSERLEEHPGSEIDIKVLGSKPVEYCKSEIVVR